jgi:hypothetical protein
MKPLIAAIIMFCYAEAAAAGSCRLFLLPTDPYLKRSGSVSFDVYLYNDTRKAVKLPSLEMLAADWNLKDVSGKRLYRTGGSRTIVDHPAENRQFDPGRIEHRRVELEIDPEPGDLVTVYVTLGDKAKVRSNTVLLFRPNSN